MDRPVRRDEPAYRVVEKGGAFHVEWYEPEEPSRTSTRRRSLYIRHATAEASLPSRFPDEAAARRFLEAARWPDGPLCPLCRASAWPLGTEGLHRCSACRRDFTVRTGTPLHRSRVSLRTWTTALFLVARFGRRLRSVHLADELGVTQKSAWYLIFRLSRVSRRAPLTLEEAAGVLFGEVESGI